MRTKNDIQLADFPLPDISEIERQVPRDIEHSLYRQYQKDVSDSVKVKNNKKTQPIEGGGGQSV